MSGSRSLAEHVADQLAPLGAVTVHRYFGGWAVRSHGRQFAMVMDTLYFRVDDAARSSYEEAGSVPFSYRAAGREVVVRSYYSVPAEAIDDRSELCARARAALA
ncbi:TfoX/Sxy family protein [Kitasatospora sp. MAP5-34]|uniref:TfoX/Sxy family protein n=1 Tax=Kitasatospora sp. MAP5-34 TaxID=3035102 RepID=UPI002474A620|nr:TfoX/Sxy family protein [Kitasatospora sp. MAP5-34]MDH6576201.1 DNA transformation protein [Kitasatospora sp. MAP5-34]